MSLRETLQQKPLVGYALGGVIVVTALWIIALEVKGFHKLPQGASNKAYYTTEDQLTGDAALNALFIDSATKATPFDHNGKPAYFAVVYVCNGGRTRWVNTLKRYTPQTKPKVEEFIAAAVAKGAKYNVDTSGFDGSMEVKPPGSGPWIAPGTPDWYHAMVAKVPAGANADDLIAETP